jgi:cell division septum initiation protein DivIVA
VPIQNEPTIYGPVSEADYYTLLEELEELREENRKLRQELKQAQRTVSKAEQSSAEAQRAHQKMVQTLTETMRENTELVMERDLWRARARRANAAAEDAYIAADLEATIGIDISDDEVRAIRKAIARVHHPDSGGNAERMKLWNATLDRIERQASQ